MALQSSGAISLNEIHIEAGGTSGTQAGLNDSDIRALIDKAAGTTMSFSEWYGASANVTVTLSSNATNRDVSSLFGSDFSANVAKILVINSGVEIGATNTGNYAIHVPTGMGGTLNIQNAGIISGAGGAGSTSTSSAGGNGQAAININSNGVTVTNTGTIRGGGGGGGKGSGGGSTGGTYVHGGGVVYCYSGTYGAGGNGGNGQGYNQSQSNGAGGSLGSGNSANPASAYEFCVSFHTSGTFVGAGYGSSGGNGGSYGNAGNAGGGSGSQGGSAGKYINLGGGISYSLSNSGTLLGQAP